VLLCTSVTMVRDEGGKLVSVVREEVAAEEFFKGRCVLRREFKALFKTDLNGVKLFMRILEDAPE